MMAMIARTTISSMRLKPACPRGREGVGLLMAPLAAIDVPEGLLLTELLLIQYVTPPMGGVGGPSAPSNALLPVTPRSGPAAGRRTVTTSPRGGRSDKTRSP